MIDRQKHLKIFNQLYSERTNLDGTYELIARYVMPGKGRFFETFSDSEESIDWDNRDLYDNTAVVAAETLAASMHGNLTNPASDWFAFRFRSEELNQNKDAKVWLEECQKRIWFAIQESNFNQAVQELYLDTVGYGTGVMVETYDNEKGLVFTTYMTRGAYFVEDSDGFPIAVYRKRQWTPAQILEKFGDKTPDDIREKAEEGQGSEKLTVIQCIFKRDIYEGDDDIDFTKPVAPHLRPYQECYILEKDAEVELHDPIGHYEMPGFVLRWKRSAGSKFGYSQSMVAMPDILSCNQLTEYILKATEKKIDPPILAKRRGTFGNISLKSGSLNIVSDMNNLKPFDGGADINVGELERAQLINAIRSAFYIDKLELKESPAMTATEVNVRYEMMMRLLGPVVSRVQVELLEPMLLRTFSLMMRNNLLPAMPDVVAQNAADFEIEYLGPMARAQRMGDVDAMARFTGMVLPLMEVKQDIADPIDFDQMMRIAAEAMGVPAKVIRDATQTKEIRDQRAEQQARTQELADAEVGATAMDKVAGAQLKGVQAQQLAAGG